MGDGGWEMEDGRWGMGIKKEGHRSVPLIDQPRMADG